MQSTILGAYSPDNRRAGKGTSRHWAAMPGPEAAKGVCPAHGAQQPRVKQEPRERGINTGLHYSFLHGRIVLGAARPTRTCFFHPISRQHALQGRPWSSQSPCHGCRP